MIDAAESVLQTVSITFEGHAMRTMAGALVVLFLSAGSVATSAPVPKELTRKNDAQLILGKWKQVTLSVHGGGANGGTGGDFYFNADGKCGIGGSPAEYTLDQPQGRMKWLNGPEKTEWRCLYVLEKNTLKVCFIDHGAAIPAKLEPGPNATIYTLSRVE